MVTSIRLSALCILSAFTAHAQLTPVHSLNLQSTAVEVPQQFKTTFPGNYSVNLPDGYGARIFYAGGLGKPRFLSFDHRNVLHVADYTNGKVYALPDTDHNGIADTMIEAAGGFTLCHDVKFLDQHMYVTEEHKVWKLTDTNNDGIYDQRVVFIDNIADMERAGLGHRTRTLTFDSAHAKAYLSIGSSCNVCRENKRAIIEEYNMDGTGKRLFASGVRNAVGLAVHPVTGKLWANNNGSDQLGNETPPEWFDIVRDNGFYGWPFAYGNKTWFDFNAHSDYQALLPITAPDSARVNTLVFPAAQVEAHSAPMALTFLNNSFPAMENGMLSALRGSWNTPNAYRGYKLIYLHLANAADTTVDYIADFCTGFITDTVNRTYWARPVGLAVNATGSVFMSSDETNKFIMEIYPLQPTGLAPAKNFVPRTVYPNPAGEKFFIKTPERGIAITLFDIAGNEMSVTITPVADGYQVETGSMTPGVYFCRISANGSESYHKLILQQSHE
jgi:glucose/arabinose dehydrogenase